MAIIIDGKVKRNLQEQVLENAKDIEDIQDRLSELSTAMIYKGSVATYDDLPTEGNEVGDFYNVLDTGDNYAWDGESWDQIASSVDLSNLVDLDTTQIITGDKTFIGEISSSEYTLGNGMSVKNHAPGSDNYLDLIQGSSNRMAIGSAIYSYVDFLPGASGQKSLGSNSMNWKELHLGSASTAGIGKITFHNPTASNQGDWYIGSESQSQGLKLAQVGQTGITISRPKVEPMTTNYWSLGSQNSKWKDLWLSGELKDGTNSVKVADIAQKGQTIIGTGTFSSGSCSFSNVSDFTDGLYFFTYGNCQAFGIITSTMLASSSQSPITIPMPVIYSGGQGSSRIGQLKIVKLNQTSIVLYLYDNQGVQVQDGFQITVIKTKLA